MTRPKGTCVYFLGDMNGSSKKLINSPQACVEDCLKGFVAANPGLSLLPGHNVIIRRDIEKVKAADKVTLLCGGGSGHEPAHAGAYLFASFNMLMNFTIPVEFKIVCSDELKCSDILHYFGPIWLCIKLAQF